MSYLYRYLQYIDNCGGAVTVDNFDEDWEPVGPTVRKDLEKEGLIIYEDKEDESPILIKRSE